MVSVLHSTKMVNISVSVRKESFVHEVTAKARSRVRMKVSS